MRLSLYEFETGAATIGGDRAIYDIANDTASFGAAEVEGHALVWQLDETPEQAEGALLSRRVQFDPRGSARPALCQAGDDLRQCRGGELGAENELVLDAVFNGGHQRLVVS